MPRTHPSPSRIYYTVKKALVSILCVVSTHSQLPFKDDASDRYEKRDIVRGHPEASGDIFFYNFLASEAAVKGSKRPRCQ